MRHGLANPNEDVALLANCNICSLYTTLQLVANARVVYVTVNLLDHAHDINSLVCYNVWAKAALVSQCFFDQILQHSCYVYARVVVGE